MRRTYRDSHKFLYFTIHVLGVMNTSGVEMDGAFSTKKSLSVSCQ